jgi:hypothetical protein
MVTFVLAPGADPKVTVTGFAALVRVAPVEVAMLQLTEMLVVLTLIPEANIGLEKITIASRGSIALDLSIRRCKSFIGLLSSLSRRLSCRGRPFYGH